VDYGIVNFRKAGSLPLRIVKEVIRHSESFEAAAVNIGIHSSTLRRLIFGNSKPQRLTIRSILIQHEKIKKKVGV
jgi:hypothetical protein